MEKPKFDIVLSDSLRNFGGTGGGRCVQLSVNIESLTPGQAICHVEFAEQCFCSEAGEVQSSRITEEGLTLEPTSFRNVFMSFRRRSSAT